MALYRYKGVDRSGKGVQGRLDAINASDLESRLTAMQLELINYKSVTAGTGFIGGRKISRRDLITFCFHMEQLTRAGVPILEGLADLRDSVDNPRFKEVTSSIIASIEGGKSFSGALEEFPRIFDTVFVNLIRAGEQSGNLTTVLLNMTESLKWQDELAAQTKKVIMYPAFVGTVVLGVVFFLMIYLVPQLVSFVQNMDKPMPGHTKALIAVSDVFIHYWYAVLATPFALFFAIQYATYKSPYVRLKMDALKLRLWLVGPILRKIILGRFANYFALLYASGVTVLDSIKISESIVGNRVIANALGRVGQNIAEGQSISDSIESVNLFPRLVQRMIKVGENTGALDNALMNVSYFYSRDVKESIDRLQAMVEPIITVILGLILGWVMLSVLGPIYDIMGDIGG